MERKLDKNSLVLSDLHLGDGSLIEDFHSFDQFVYLISQYPNHVIIFNGDTFETWQTLLKDILRAHSDLFTLLSKREVIFVAGNHDRFLFDLEGEYFGKWFVVPNIEVQKYYIEHGHRWDDFNKNTTSLGKIVAFTGGMIERFGWRDVDDWFSRVLTAGTGKFFKLKKDVYAAFAHNTLVCNEPYGLRGVILGHTHIPLVKEFEKGVYFNTGCWCGKSKEKFFCLIENSKCRLMKIKDLGEIEEIYCG